MIATGLLAQVTGVFAETVLQSVKDRISSLLGIKVGKDVQRNVLNTMFVVNPSLAGVLDGSNLLLSVASLGVTVREDEVEPLIVDGLVGLGKVLADGVGHLFDAEAVEVGEVAAGVSALRLAVFAQFSALVPDVLDRSVADLAPDAVLGEEVVTGGGDSDESNEDGNGNERTVHHRL